MGDDRQYGQGENPWTFPEKGVIHHDWNKIKPFRKKECYQQIGSRSDAGQEPFIEVSIESAQGDNCKDWDIGNIVSHKKIDGKTAQEQNQLIKQKVS